MQLQINPEFRDLIPALTPDEYNGLEQSIIADGCRDAIVTWDGTIIDGHNRYKICQKNEIPFRTVEHDFDDDNSAKIWIIDNQRGRRNMTAEQLEYLIGVRYRLEKQQGTRTDLTSGQNDQKLDTAEKIAADYGISEKSVRRNEQFADGVDAIGRVAPAVKEKILSGKSTMTKREVSSFARSPETEVEARLQEQPIERRCTDCGLIKPASEFRIGKNLCKECDSFRRHNGKDSVKAIKQFSSAKAQAIIDELSKEMPSCEGGEMSDPDNHILADYVALVKQFRIDINKYLYMPSLFSGLSADDLACTETTKLINDLNNIIEKEKE